MSDEPKKLLPDSLFDTIMRVSPDMPVATAWKLVAAILLTIARDKGVDVT